MVSLRSTTRIRCLSLSWLVRSDGRIACHLPSEDADRLRSPKATTRFGMIWYIAAMSRANFVEWIGWLSSVLPLATLIRQVYTQWRSRSDAGVSKWLFLGQVTASLGFTTYSVLLHNGVYIASNT